MGMPELKETELKPIEPHTFPQGALEDEIAIAVKTRPDLIALGRRNRHRHRRWVRQNPTSARA